MSGIQKTTGKRLYKGLGLQPFLYGIAVIGVVLGMADHYRINSDSSTDSREMITYKNETYVKKGNLETYLIIESMRRVR